MKNARIFLIALSLILSSITFAHTGHYHTDSGNRSASIVQLGIWHGYFDLEGNPIISPYLAQF